MFFRTILDLFKSASVIFVYASLTVSILKPLQTALRMFFASNYSGKSLWGNKRNLSAAQSVVLAAPGRGRGSLWVCFSVPTGPGCKPRSHSRHTLQNLPLFRANKGGFHIARSRRLTSSEPRCCAQRFLSPGCYKAAEKETSQMPRAVEH